MAPESTSILSLLSVLASLLLEFILYASKHIVLFLRISYSGIQKNTN